jgi:hypothetical protein
VVQCSPKLITRRYDGMWSKDQRNGEGTNVNVEGTYQGQWKCNLREGEGTMKYADGSVYEGQWKDDKV